MIELFNGLIKVHGIVFFVLIMSVVIVFGYLLGKLTVKGVCLEIAGVFITALIIGALFKKTITEITVLSPGDYDSAFETIENVGLVFFVASVGFIAGPNFFTNLKKNFRSYVLLGILITAFGALTCAGCYYMGIGNEPDHDYFVSILIGVMSGALTSTPAFSASLATATDTFAAGDPARAKVIENALTAGHGMAYIFGVVGVVLFVQLIPRILHADMDAERSKVTPVVSEKSEQKGSFIEVDRFGLFTIGLAILIGIFVGSIRIPMTNKGFDGTCFNLTMTGGVLLSSIVIGYFGHIGPVSLKIDRHILEVFRELGLMLFLTGAGVPGGVDFVDNFKPVYFVYGIIITVIPMVAGFLFSKYVLKLPLFNNLGSITGGMTSTPALGALINVTKSDDVASAYAATYPFALVSVVIASQLLILFL